MNNKEYISELSQRSGYSIDDTQKLVRCVIEVLSQKFDGGDSVTIDGFGTFELKKRMERIITNPSTGQKMMVPPKIILSFKPSVGLKKTIKGTDSND